MNIIIKIKYNQYWNIGFCEQNPEELIRNKQLKSSRWLSHPYRDRWFADPFIYKVTDNEIVVFVEECPIENPKGIICELVIDRKSMQLKKRYVMLEKKEFVDLQEKSGKIMKRRCLMAVFVCSKLMNQIFLL